MGKLKYLHKSFAGFLEIEDNPDNFNGFKPDDFGVTYEDYLSRKWILLSSAQSAFVDSNPNASVREWIAMQLDPPPPEPTLQERRDMAISQAGRTAAAKPDELFPNFQVTLAALGIADELKATVYLMDYGNLLSAVYEICNDALTEITDATNVAELESALSTFNEKISLL